MTWRVLEGDCRAVLATLDAESVQTCVTSPPYWGLRDYGHEGQLGLERTPDEYVAKMVEVFREVRRVLRPDGTLWLNLGDSFFGGAGSSEKRAKDASGVERPEVEMVCERCGATFTGTNRRRFCSAFCGGLDNSKRRERPPYFLKPKDLVGIPWRVAFALQSDGWWLRSDIVWAKPNPMPESVTDRPTKAHEYVFLLAKSERYFYDADAVREEHATPLENRATKHGAQAMRGQEAIRPRGNLEACDDPASRYYAEGGRNRRSVWTISTKPFSGAHFAVMPWDLVEPCVLAGTSERGQCPACGAPRERVLERVGSVSKRVGKSAEKNAQGLATAFSGYEDGSKAPTFTTKGWRVTCRCAPACFGPLDVPQTVLDPFAGSGTVGMVARRHGRSFVGVELNPTYAAMARERIRADAPLLNLPTEAA